jgi:hypothetical protein
LSSLVTLGLWLDDWLGGVDYLQWFTFEILSIQLQGVHNAWLFREFDQNMRAAVVGALAYAQILHFSG